MKKFIIRISVLVLFIVMIVIFFLWKNDPSRTSAQSNANNEVTEVELVESTETETESNLMDAFTKTEKQFGEGQTFGVCEGDFNGDGRLDIFVTTYDGESGLYFNTEDGYELSPYKFSTAVDNAHGVATGDLDNDGDLDLFLVNNSTSSRVFFNDGTGNFESSTKTYGEAEWHGLNVTLADVDSDGDLDAFVSFYQNPAKLFLNDGLGDFEATEFEAFATETTKVLASDFNQDGFLDAYFVNGNRQDQIFTNDGNGAMTMMPELYGESVSWGGASSGDMNGDGYPDVVVANEELGASIWINDKNGNLSRFDEYVGSVSINVLLGDLDQDDDLDMVIMHNERDAELYLNDGLANFEFYKTLKSSKGSVTALIMDFDNDGKSDILIGRMSGYGGNVIYYNE